MPDRTRPFRSVKDGIHVFVRLPPGASRDHVDGGVADAKGNGVLRVAVTAAAEQGRANKALIRLLAKEWRLAKSCISLVRGAKHRDKTLLISPGSADDLRQLEEWAAGLRQRRGT